MGMNLVKYVDDLNTAYKKNRVVWETLQSSLADVKAEQISVKNSNSSSLRQAADVEELKNRENDIKAQLSELQATALKEFEGISANYNNAIKEFFTVNPDDINESAVLLINSGAVSDADLCALVEQYPDNATMLKVICSEAGKRNSSAAKALKSYLENFMNTEERTKDFNGALLTVYRALNPGKEFANPNDNYWNNSLYQTVKDEIKALESLDLDVMKSFIGV